MPMQMGFRWYGEGNDKISLSDIKQIPGVTSIVWALHNKMPGEVWEVEEIAEVQKQLEPYGFNMDVVESVNDGIHFARFGCTAGRAALTLQLFTQLLIAWEILDIEPGVCRHSLGLV